MCADRHCVYLEFPGLILIRAGFLFRRLSKAELLSQLPIKFLFPIFCSFAKSKIINKLCGLLQNSPSYPVLKKKKIPGLTNN